MHPDDVNILCDLEDHNFSLDTNNYNVTYEDGAVEPCLPAIVIAIWQ